MQGVDHAAHLDELLPVAAVAREAGHLPGRHGAHLAEAALGNHALEACAQGAAGRRTAQVLVGDLDLRPAELRQALAHGVLQHLAFPVVLNLVDGRLANVEHCLAGPVLGADLASAHGRRPCGTAAVREQRRRRG